MIDYETLEESKYWSIGELSSPDDSTSWRLVDRDFLLKLTELRVRYNKPIIPTSVFRTAQHNSFVGGVSKSAHLLGMAADLPVSWGDNKITLESLESCETSRERWDKLSKKEVPTTELIQAAIDVGFNRIGIGNTFIHIDSDKSKAKNVVWIYK